MASGLAGHKAFRLAALTVSHSSPHSNVNSHSALKWKISQTLSTNTPYTSRTYRLYPTKTQVALFEETIETCRRHYNTLLAERRLSPKSVFLQNREMAIRRKNDRFLSRVHSQVLQDVAFRLDKAMVAWGKGICNPPRFKRKGRYNSFTFPQFKQDPLRKGRIHFGLIGDVKIRIHREVGGRIKRVTIFKDVNQWFANLTVWSQLAQPLPANISCVGIDLGIEKIATLSDGTSFSLPQHMKSSSARLIPMYRNLSRKIHGSKNREKARIRLATAYRKLRRQRIDFSHKVSHYLANRYRIVVFEDLRIVNMVRNHSIASAIMESMWGLIRQLTAYKAERRLGRVVVVPPQMTSQICSGCGEIVKKPGSARVHRCQACGLTLDRDVNAAKNILRRGLEEAYVEARPLLVTRISKFGQGREKLANTEGGHFTPSTDPRPFRL